MGAAQQDSGTLRQDLTVFTKVNALVAQLPGEDSNPHLINQNDRSCP
jgi:hypothetical protein